MTLEQKFITDVFVSLEWGQRKTDTVCLRVALLITKLGRSWLDAFSSENNSLDPKSTIQPFRSTGTEAVRLKWRLHLSGKWRHQRNVKQDGGCRCGVPGQCGVLEKPLCGKLPLRQALISHTERPVRWSHATVKSRYMRQRGRLQYCHPTRRSSFTFGGGGNGGKHYILYFQLYIVQLQTNRQ